MTLEQFEQARNMRTNEFAICCEADPDFELEYYSWVDYLTVVRLQQEGLPFDPPGDLEEDKQDD